jgi:organic hydroperoxide reductase OsmC/OhrA
MTQIGRYGHMLKVQIGNVRMRVTARYRVDGSVLADTVRAQLLGVETHLDLESPDEPDQVAKVVRTAENGCFVMQALKNPVPIQGTVTLNGAELASAGPKAR